MKSFILALCSFLFLLSYSLPAEAIRIVFDDKEAQQDLEPGRCFNVSGFIDTEDEKLTGDFTMTVRTQKPSKDDLAPGIEALPNKLVKITNPKVNVKCVDGECLPNPVVVEHCFVEKKTQKFLDKQAN